MARFRYSFHANLSPAENLGLLVWDDCDAAYYGRRGHEGRTDEIARAVRERLGRPAALRELIDYYLDRGGGGYQSFSVPEEIEADSVVDAAAGSRRRGGSTSRCPSGRGPAAPPAAAATTFTS